MYKMSEIAKELCISQTTVSLCLSGKAGKYKISEKTEKRVKDFAAKHGFAPNIMAQSLATSSKKTVGILFGLTAFEAKNQLVVRSVINELSEKNWSYYTQHFTHETIVDSVVKMKGMGVSAIIIIGMPSNKKIIDQLIPFAKNISLFCIDYMFNDADSKKPVKNIYKIGIDREAIYINLFEALYKMGHSKIVIDTPRARKTEAYKKFLKNNGLNINNDFILEEQASNKRFKIGTDFTERVIYLKNKYNITAVSLHDDQIAAALITDLINRGIKIPDDISVIGFDNIESAPYFRVPLATVDVPLEKMVTMAIKAICDNKQIDLISILESKFIHRESLGKAVVSKIT